jgi:hypothetical protein
MNTKFQTSNSVADPYGVCMHERTRIEHMSSGQIHYARRVCCDCQRQLCWIANPANTERRRNNAANLKTLLAEAPLNSYERDFCQNIINKHSLSPKQQGLLNALSEKYLTQKGHSDSESPEKRNGALVQECAA